MTLPAFRALEKTRRVVNGDDFVETTTEFLNESADAATEIHEQRARGKDERLYETTELVVRVCSRDITNVLFEVVRKLVPLNSVHV